MAGFFDKCLASAVEQGVISQSDADAIKGVHDEKYAQASKAGEADPAASARAATAKIFEEEAGHKRKIAKLAAERRDAIAAYGEAYRDPGTKKADIFGAFQNLIENFGYGAGTSSLAGRALSKYNMATAQLSELMDQFAKSKLTGIRRNKAGAVDMVESVYGKTTTPEAKAMADAVNTVNDDIREQFNALGGRIKKLEGPWLPQDHNPVAVLRGGKDKRGFEGWHDYIVPKLDLDRMRDPLSDTPLSSATPERLKSLLQVAWDHIVTNGWSDRKPTAQAYGVGALYNQRQDHRFLHFKDADSWLAYNRDFGSGDPISAVFKHVRSMTNDIAKMEMFGPNPTATLEWMKQVVSSETAKFTAGKPSLFAETKLSKAQDFIGYGPKKLQALYDGVTGGPVASGRIAAFIGDVRNFLGSGQLGSSVVLAATQDPMLDMAARRFSGIPAARAMGAIFKAFSRETRDVAARAALGLDEFNHILGSEARYSGVLGGHDWSRYLVERTLAWSGLEPITQARKSLFGIDFMGAVADRRNLSFEELGNEFPAMRRTFEDYGITEKDWNKIRATEPHSPAQGSAPLLRPIDVADRRLGERYLEVMLQQTERAVPTGTAGSKALATMGTTRGTIAGELVQSVLQYKAFSLSLMALQWQAIMTQARGGNLGGAALGAGALGTRIAANAAALVIPLTMAGAAAMQLKNLANGKDMQDMGNANFWLQALQYGGGFGIMGDFVLSESNRFGQSPLESMLGPTYGLGKDITGLMIGNFAAWRRGEKTHIARDVIDKGLGRYMPAVSSLWYTRLAYRRMLLDQLQYAADPQAHQHFRRTEQNLHRESGQGYFWRPGETLPEREPVFAGKPRR